MDQPHTSIVNAGNERISRVTYMTCEAARQDITRYIEFW